MITQFSGFNQSLSRVASFKTSGMDAVDYAVYFQLIFGASASQTSTLLRIKKADLIGLVATSNNSAQALLVALLLKTLSSYNSKNGSIYATFWGASISGNLLINQIIINLFNQLIPVDTYELPEPTNVVNPMDY